MAGASLIPEYYKKKMRVAIFLAPVASWSNNKVPALEFMAKPNNRKIIKSLLNTLKIYNVLPYNYLEAESCTFLCGLWNGKLCDLALGYLLDSDPSVDNE